MENYRATVFSYFCISHSKGYRHTSSKLKYSSRLFIFGLISQIPYYFFVPGKLNIMFTLFLGLLIIEVYESKYQLVSFPLLFIGYFFPVSYGVYGLSMILIFHMTYGDANKTMLGYFALSILYYLSSWNQVQALSVFALLPILLDPKTQIKVPRLVGYLFYPGHIAALLLIQNYYFM